MDEEPVEPCGGCAPDRLPGDCVPGTRHCTRGELHSLTPTLSYWTVVFNSRSGLASVPGHVQHCTGRSVVIALVAAIQVANRPFRFLRIVRIVRYVRSLRMLAATIVSAIPATLKVRLVVGCVCEPPGYAVRWVGPDIKLCCH